MANQQIKRLFRRRSEIDESDFESLQSRVMERLTAADRSAGAPERRTESERTEHATGVTAEGIDAAHVIDLETGAVVAATFVIDEESGAAMTGSSLEYPGLRGLDSTFDGSVVPAVWRFETDELAGLIAAKSIVEIDERSTDGEATIETDEPADAFAEARVDVVEPADSVVSALSEFDAFVLSATKAPIEAVVATAAHRVVEKPTPAAEADSMGTDAMIETRSPRAPASRTSPTRSTVAGPATTSAPAERPYCPSCALLLDPPPERSRRCPRCRERIVVKHVDGRAIYLTEAAVAIFDSERRRTANAPRWKRERQRWLKVAAATNADAGRIARIDSMPISEESVTAARNLYAATVVASFRAAKHDRRWEEASRIMREHAQVLFRFAGSPIPPPDDIVQPHRDGAAAMLRGISEMSREADLVSGRCCDVCATDDGKTFRIALELRTPRLPHAGCPRGLCRCEWYLAVRDQVLVRRQLRRRARADVASSSTGS